AGLPKRHCHLSANQMGWAPKLGTRADVAGAVPAKRSWCRQTATRPLHDEDGIALTVRWRQPWNVMPHLHVVNCSVQFSSTLDYTPDDHAVKFGSRRSRSSGLTRYFPG